jgi:hypothetical protein
MTTTFTSTQSSTFTLTHARYMASKVATDLKRIQRFYGSPSDTSIQNYETEIAELLKAGYLDSVTYGFRKDSNWIEPSIRYTAKDLAPYSNQDDDPGKIRPGANITGASFYSYLTYSREWSNLSEAQKQAFEENLPFQRGGAPEPGIEGYLSSDKTYSSGGKSLDRSTVRSFQ